MNTNRVQYGQAIGVRLLLFSVWFAIIMFSFAFMKQQVVVYHEESHKVIFDQWNVPSYITYESEGGFYTTGSTHPLNNNCDSYCNLAQANAEAFTYPLMGILDGLKIFFILLGIYFLILYPIVQRWAIGRYL